MIRYKLGIDVGGTFTDFFLWGSDGRAESAKVLTTRADPALGLLAGLEELAARRGLAPAAFLAAIDVIVHGTTVTTNAVLTRGGARTALLTTAGVRDALEMRRGIREEPYDNRLTNVPPLVPRRLRLPLGGRIDAQGREIEPLRLDDLRATLAVCRRERIEAIAVCLLNSFANPDHERAVAEIVRKELPGVWLSVSSEVLPTIRFYNRVSTTVLDAYVGPVLGRYLESLSARLAGAGFRGVLLVMQSNGGLAPPATARRLPASTLLSGPAGGPRAGAACAAPHGVDAIVVDMGGTSFDASLVRAGEAALKSEGEIERLRIALPHLDIVTIGAGGGSIGRIDEGGLLRMGPRSAGAEPGPACYGRGGRLPTSTDADLVLGYLDADWFAGGRIKLDVAAARAAIESEIARPLGLTVEAAAAGMYRVINANMAHGVRQVSVRRGIDPREFALVVAGGAGPIHALPIALELEIPLVIVPAIASVLCAAGMLMGDVQHDYACSFVGPLAGLDRPALARRIAELAATGRRQLLAEGVAPERIVLTVALDLRYVKQYHEVTVPAAWSEQGGLDLEAVARDFHRLHDRLYGYDLEAVGTGLELINLRVRAVGRTDRPELARIAAGGADPGPAAKGVRRAWVPERERFEEMPVYDGHRLLAGNRLAGPALIERVDTTLFVSPSYDAEVDALGSIVLRRKGDASHV